MQITSLNTNDLSEPRTIVLLSFTVIPFLLLILLTTIGVCCNGNGKTIKTDFSDLFDETPILKFIIPFTFTILCSFGIALIYFTITRVDYSTIKLIIVILELCPIPIIFIRLIGGLFRILGNRLKQKTIGKN